MRKTEVLRTIMLSFFISLGTSFFAPNFGIVGVPMLLSVIYLLASINHLQKDDFGFIGIFLIFPTLFYVFLKLTGLLTTMQLSIYYP